MKKFKFKIRGNKYEVHIKDFEDSQIELEVNGTSYKVEVEQEMKKRKTPTLVRPKVPVKAGDGTIKKTEQTGVFQVKAPLPGSIFKLLVKEGDTIQKGQTLLIMEAMKMENNITSEKSGEVKSIKVSEGTAVLQNDVLIEIIVG